MSNFEHIIKHDLDRRAEERDERKINRRRLRQFLSMTLSDQFEVEDTEDATTFYVPALGINISVTPLASGEPGMDVDVNTGVTFFAPAPDDESGPVELRRPADFADAGVTLPEDSDE